jgi:hypothetical protein
MALLEAPGLKPCFLHACNAAPSACLRTGSKGSLFHQKQVRPIYETAFSNIHAFKGFWVISANQLISVISGKKLALSSPRLRASAVRIGFSKKTQPRFESVYIRADPR